MLGPVMWSWRRDRWVARERTAWGVGRADMVGIVDEGVGGDGFLKR